MRARVRDRLAGRAETGFTMIELVASLTIFTIGILALVDVMTSSFSVVASSGGRTNAVALATKQAEALRAQRYDDVSITPSPTPPSATSYPPPIDGVSYSVTTVVSWANASLVGSSTSTTLAQAYKQADITVSWADRAGNHSVRQTTLLYPGGRGPLSTTTTTAADACSTPAAPPLLTATGGTSILLSWTLPSPPTYIVGWVIDYTPDNWAHVYRATSRQAKSKTSFIMDGLAAGATYSFRVAAYGACGQLSAWSPTASAAVSASLAINCTYGQATVTPSAILKTSSDPNSYLVADANVIVNTTGPCHDLSLRYTTHGTAVTTVSMSGTGNVFTKTLNGTATNWDLGVHVITLLDSAGVAQGSMALTVCSYNASNCP